MSTAGPHEEGNFFFARENDPEMFKLIKADFDLERQTRDLAGQYRRAPRPSARNSKRN